MLAYVFWHYPKPEIARAAYESNLLDFHAALHATDIAGFRASLSYRVANLSWINDGAAAYEDWYFVADSGALDPLNEAAVSARRQASHDRAATSVAQGAGGLYRLRSGSLSVTKSSAAYWFSKPAGMSYGALDAALQINASGAALWQRQMVLGPGAEFCCTGARTTLPAVLEALCIERSALDAP